MWLVLSSVREVRCPDGVIDHPEMSATFRCLGIEVRQDGDSHYMHVLLDKASNHHQHPQASDRRVLLVLMHALDGGDLQVDVEKVKLVMWALYALQGTPLSPANTDKPGLIKTDGRYYHSPTYLLWAPSIRASTDHDPSSCVMVWWCCQTTWTRRCSTW